MLQVAEALPRRLLVDLVDREIRSCTDADELQVLLRAEAGKRELFRGEGEPEEADLERMTETLTMERVVRIREAQ